MDREAILTHVPEELLCMTAECLDTPDLIALRQTCREVCDKVDDVFTKRHFSIRTHIYTQHGLQSLTEITKVPRLAGRVRHIEVVVRKLHSNFYEGRYSWDSSRYQRTTFAEEGILHTVPTKKQVENEQQQRIAFELKQEARREAWLKWRAEQGVLKQAHVWLTQAFKNLAQNGNSPSSLAVCDQALDWADWPSCRPIWGLLRLHKTLGDVVEPNDIIEGSCDAAVSAVLTAVVSSRVVVQELNLCADSETYGLTARQCVFHKPILESLSISFARLTSLSIGVYPCGVSDWLIRERHCLFDLIGSLTHLRRLRISGLLQEDWSEPDFIQDIVNALPSCPLQNLEIQEIRTHQQALSNFVMKFKATLKHVNLSCLQLPRREEWKAVIQLCAFESLTLGALSVGEYPDRWELKVPELAFFNFQDGESVKRGVHKLLAEGYYAPYD